MAQDRIGGIVRSPAETSPLDNPDLSRWSDNYFRLFNQRPDLSQVRIPGKPVGVGPTRSIVVAAELVEWTQSRPLEGVQEALKKHFRCQKHSPDLDAEIPTNDRDPRNGTCAVWVRDVREADNNLKNLSVDDLVERNIPGITILERQLLEADYFFEKGEHLDQMNITLCTGSRTRAGYVPGVDWGLGGFGVDWFGLSHSNPYLRSRRVWA